jgi:elongation factor G
MGERHFEILLGWLQEVRRSPSSPVPRVAYRETLWEKARGRASTRNRVAGADNTVTAGCVSPRPRSGYKFVDSIVGGVIPNRYIPAVDRGIQESAVRGVVAGYPMVDFQAECYDGSYHDVDSNEVSFKMAGIPPSGTLHRGAGQCCWSRCWTSRSGPRRNPGRCDGDLSSRRGQILGTDTEGRLTRIKAIVPEAELYKYATTLHSITHGRGISI